MNDEELRKKIYEILGLEFGSLSNEGGNDWIRAKNEALEEYKKKEFEKLKNLEVTDYLTLDKNSEEYKSVLYSKFNEMQNFKILLAQRNDLTEDEIQVLIKDGNKDIVINLCKTQNLSTSCIDIIIPNSVYLTKKYLIEKQKLSDDHKSKLIESMTNSSLNYSELISSINED